MQCETIFGFFGAQRVFNIRYGNKLFARNIFFDFFDFQTVIINYKIDIVIVYNLIVEFDRWEYIKLLILTIFWRKFFVKSDYRKIFAAKVSRAKIDSSLKTFFV